MDVEIAVHGVASGGGGMRPVCTARAHLSRDGHFALVAGSATAARGPFYDLWTWHRPTATAKGMGDLSGVLCPLGGMHWTEGRTPAHVRPDRSAVIRNRY